MTLPKVAIIYLTYNGKDSYRDITRCLQSLEQIHYPKEQIELICVENPSPHGASWPFIESEWRPKCGVSFPNLTVIKNEKDLGYSGANNVGIKAAIEKGCVYAFLLNQDADVDLDFLERAVTRAEADPKIMFVQSLLLLGDHRDIVNSIGNRYHFLGYGYSGGFGWTKERALAYFSETKETNPDQELMYFSGAAVLVRTAYVQEIGLFDTAFYMYHEDVDASFNAKIHGYKTVIELSSVVFHYYEFSRSIKKFFWMERNRFVVLFTYYKLGTLFLIAPFLLGVEIASFLLALKSGWWKEKLRAWAFFFKPSSWKWILARRKKAQRERIISDAELLAHAESEILFQEAPNTDATKNEVLSDVRGSIVTKIGNPALAFIWKLLKPLIRR